MILTTMMKARAAIEFSFELGKISGLRTFIHLVKRNLINYHLLSTENCDLEFFVK